MVRGQALRRHGRPGRSGAKGLEDLGEDLEKGAEGRLEGAPRVDVVVDGRAREVRGDQGVLRQGVARREGHHNIIMNNNNHDNKADNDNDNKDKNN